MEDAMKRYVTGALASFAVFSIAASSYALALHPNQTAGYGEGKVLTFTYTQNFDCVEQPSDDLNFNGIVAARDPGETQTPICQAGDAPKINPPGARGYGIKTTDPIYVLVPMFSVNNDQNANDAISCTGVVAGTLCGPALGTELIQLFGAVPEAFKATPLVYTQCPDNGSRPGTCTMHASQVDLAPVLAKLGYIANPPTANVFVPTPNHSHVIPMTTVMIAPEWWQVRPVLVLHQSDWPAQDASSGITSIYMLQAAIKAGRAVEAPSNFFLYFGSQVTGGAMPMGH
jgi:hypothetical protein